MLDNEPIHGWFGLSYANYLVLNRSVLQSMPVEWQRRFVGCLEELTEATRDLETADNYDVRVLARQPEHLTSELCETCDGTGKRLDEDGQPVGGEAELGEPIAPEERCPDECDHGLVETDRWETVEEVGVVSDPIPHYNRGRARVELAV